MTIQIENLSKKYKHNLVFSNVNLTVKEQSFVAIHGTSGSGKSTLLNIIGLLEKYDSGVLKLFKKNAPPVNSKHSLLMQRSEISYLFQNFGLIEDETIEDNLDIALVYEKLPKSEKLERKKQVLESVNLSYDLKTKIYELSGGEKQRVALARVLLKKSKLILADEPTGSLDDTNKEDILKLLRKEQDKGKTIILATHDPTIIKNCDSSLLIRDKAVHLM